MVFNSPHSGNHLPPGLLQQARLSEAELRASEDSHVDALFAGCVDVGAPIMRSLVSRSFIDLNREPYELDVRMFEERLPGFMNTSSPRVACGLGTVPKTVGDGLNIYAGTIKLEDALNRIETIYRPYHRTLAALLDEARAAADVVLLMDCHSMPATAVTALRSPGHGQVDVVLGDRYGCSCMPEIVDAAERCLKQAGLTVVRNKPYAGGYFTESHGQPREGRHALQIEINRSLYMNESTRQLNTGFMPTRTAMDGLARTLANILAEIAGPDELPLAAE